MKNVLTLIYVVGFFIYGIVDVAIHYGEDGFMFWLCIRPFLAFIKAIFWPILILV